MFEIFQTRITEDDTLLINSVGWEEASEMSESINEILYVV